MPGRHPRRSVPLRLLLRLYPADFRARFADEMLETWSELWRRPRSGLAWAAFALRFTHDVVASAVAERLETRRARRAAAATGAALGSRDRLGLAALAADVRFALRALRRRPVFTAAVIGTIALGIGPNTAVFSLIDAVVLRPLPIADADRVVALFATNDRWDGRISYLDLRDLDERTRSLDRIAGYADFDVALEEGEFPQQISAGLVTGHYFSVLGLRPEIGRLLGPEDGRVRGATPFVVLSHSLWSRRFGADPGIVGGTIRLAGRPFTVVGVAPPRFRGTDLASPIDLWVPVTMNQSLHLGAIFGSEQALDIRALPLLHAFGRLAADETPERAQAELNRNFAVLLAEFPRTGGARDSIPNPISVSPIAESAVLADRGALLDFLRMLVATVVLTLLLASVNAANLLLVRASERTRELGVRAALGADRTRIVRQLLAESTVLALAGGAAGLIVAALTMRLFTAFTLPGHVALDGLGLGLDPRVLGFTVALSMLTAIGCGLAPALRASGPSSASATLAGHDRATARAPRGVLLGTQVAITFVLLVGASLFIRSMREGLSTDLGFDPARLWAIDVQPRLQGYDTEPMLHLYREIEARASRLPGVAAAAVTSHLPLERPIRVSFSRGPAPSADDAAPPVQATEPAVEAFAMVTPGFFETIGIALRAGRIFTAADVRGAPRVMVINESAARALWGSESPIGRPITMHGYLDYTVVGVVADTKYETLGDADVPFAFAPLAQEPNWNTTVVVRARGDVPVLPALSDLLRELAPGVPQVRPRAVREQIDAVLMPQRFGATLLTTFAVLALGIAAVGVYGTVAYTVSRQVPEIGIRIALGAQRRHVLHLVLWRTGVALGVGVLTGIVGAIAGSRAITALLYGVAPSDVVSFAGAAIALLVCGLLVALVPARRATHIDPARTIRSV